MVFKLPELPYAPAALEPHVDARTMEIHHGKHHAAYTNNLNGAIEKEKSLDGKPIEALLANLNGVPESVRMAVRNNGGGYYNHDLFWKWMKPNGGGEPTGPLGAAITSQFGSFGAFQEQFAAAAVGRFGSGWAWLVKVGDTLKVTSTPNQDNPLMQGVVDVVGSPVLGLDVWEHAYYLNYQNRRPDYIKAWWNVVNWDFASQRYAGK